MLPTSNGDKQHTTTRADKRSIIQGRGPRDEKEQSPLFSSARNIGDVGAEVCWSTEDHRDNRL